MIRLCASPLSAAQAGSSSRPDGICIASAAGEPADADYGTGGFGGIQELPNLNKPIIAAVNGMAVGGGFELALSADLIIAAEHARFALPEISAGTLAEAATIRLPRRIPYHIAMELLLLGRWMDAREAQQRGIVSEVVAAEELMPRARAMAALLAAGSAAGVRRHQRGVAGERDFEFYRCHAAHPAAAFPSVAALYSSDDQKEGARAFAAKRAPVWRGR
jgi:crotonobetainyl-CoA hydratase